MTQAAAKAPTAQPDYRGKSPYLTVDGSFDLAWIRERAATRARNIAAKGYRREGERELFREFLSEEMQIALQVRDGRFPPVHITGQVWTADGFRQLAIAEAIACGEMFLRDFSKRDFSLAESCFICAEIYTKRAAELDWQNAAPVLAMAAE